MIVVRSQDLVAALLRPLQHALNAAEGQLLQAAPQWNGQVGTELAVEPSGNSELAFRGNPGLGVDEQRANTVAPRANVRQPSESHVKLGSIGVPHSRALRACDEPVTSAGACAPTRSDSPLGAQEAVKDATASSANVQRAVRSEPRDPSVGLVVGHVVDLTAALRTEKCPAGLALPTVAPSPTVVGAVADIGELRQPSSTVARQRKLHAVIRRESAHRDQPCAVELRVDEAVLVKPVGPRFPDGGAAPVPSQHSGSFRDDTGSRARPVDTEGSGLVPEGSASGARSSAFSRSRFVRATDGATRRFTGESELPRLHRPEPQRPPARSATNGSETNGSAPVAWGAPVTRAVPVRDSIVAHVDAPLLVKLQPPRSVTAHESDATDALAAAASMPAVNPSASTTVGSQVAPAPGCETRDIGDATAPLLDASTEAQPTLDRESFEDLLSTILRDAARQQGVEV